MFPQPFVTVSHLAMIIVALNCISLHVFNLSLVTGGVPESPKVAKITPVFKKGEKVG